MCIHSCIGALSLLIFLLASRGYVDGAASKTQPAGAAARSRDLRKGCISRGGRVECGRSWVSSTRRDAHLTLLLLPLSSPILLFLFFLFHTLQGQQSLKAVHLKVYSTASVIPQKRIPVVIIHSSSILCHLIIRQLRKSYLQIWTDGKSPLSPSQFVLPYYNNGIEC